MPKVTRNEIYNHIADGLHDRMPETGEAEVGMDHTKLFLRMGGQVFVITVEEKQQFAKNDDPEKAARGFMATLPIWPWTNER